MASPEETLRRIVWSLLHDADDRASTDKDLRARWVELARKLEETDPTAWHRVLASIKSYGSSEAIEQNIEELVSYATRRSYGPPDSYFEVSKEGDTGKFQAGELAKDLLENEHFLVIGDEGERGTLWYAENGYYHPHGEMFVRQKIEQVLGRLARHVNRTQRIEVADQVKSACIKWQRDIPDDSDLIPVINGALNWRERTLRPYDLSRDVFFFQLPARYDPDADCPQIRGFLDNIAPQDVLEAVLDVAASTLYRRPMKDCLAAIGPPDSGKTTFAFLLTALLGEKNVTAIPLQSLVRDRFAPSGLKNRLLNVYDDLGTKKLADVATFNAQTGGGSVRYERKHCDATEFIPHAKHIFLANKMPPIDAGLSTMGDDVKAFFRRLHAERFPNVFVESPEPGTNQRKKEDLDVLRCRLTDEKELSGFLNILLERLEHVVKHGPRWSKSSQDSMIAYFRSSNSFQAFFSEYCAPRQRREVSKDAFREAYLWYCDENGLEPVDPRTIHECLVNSGIGEHQDPPKVKPRLRWWTGVEVLVEKLEQDGSADVAEKVRKGTRERGTAITPSTSEITGGVQANLNSITGITRTASNMQREERGFDVVLPAVKETPVNPVISCDFAQVFNIKVRNLQERACPDGQPHHIEMLKESIDFVAKTKEEGGRPSAFTLRKHLTSQFETRADEAISLVDRHYVEIEEVGGILRQIKSSKGGFRSA